MEYGTAIALIRDIEPLGPATKPTFDCAACPAFPKPAAFPISTGVVLIVGLIVSYFFQFLSFYRCQSSKGVSSFSMGLALLSSLLTLTNFLILHWTTVVCCACVNVGPCVAANLTPLQLFVNVLCLLFIYSCFLWYFPLEPYSIFRQQRAKEYTRAQATLAVTIVISVVFSATSAILYYGIKVPPQSLHTFGRVIGVISALVVVVQWTPQIFTTFQLGSAGSLSIAMLVMQMPGCLLTVFFQAVIGGADITTWGPYLITAINTMILIIMCLVFWVRDRNGVIEDNMDLWLSEDEHHVYEYDHEAGALSRKSYGSLAFPPPYTPPPLSYPSGQSTSPTSGKLAWSLSDRNGLKGKLSAATFITSGTSNRTRAHLSGKDLLGTSRGHHKSGFDQRFNAASSSKKFEIGFEPEDGDLFGSLGSEGTGTIQPPPNHNVDISPAITPRNLSRALKVSFSLTNPVESPMNNDSHPSFGSAYEVTERSDTDADDISFLETQENSDSSQVPLDP